METNDILRRRQTPISSGYRQGLLQHDHLTDNTNIGHYYNKQHSSHPFQHNRPLLSSQNQVVATSRYLPPTDIFETNPTSSKTQQHPQWKSLSQYQGENIDSLLYLSTPRPTSIRRTIQSQTPSRTLVYNNIFNEHPYNESLNSMTASPTYDYGSGSLFSYGCCCLQCVRTTEVGILENFGRFEALLEPGFHCIAWPLVDIGARLSLRIRQLEITCETKTSDSVFCNLVITLQFRIIVEKAYDAFYRLTDPSEQIQSFAFDVIRSKVPKMTLDEVFSCKSDIAREVQNKLEKVLCDYGYEILNALLTDVRPVDKVVQSMNEINASKRLKTAMAYIAESEKIKQVKYAEAHCEALYLHGVGVAAQQKALAEEMKGSFKAYMDEGNSQKEVMNLLFMTVYMDTISAVSSLRGSNEDSNGSDLLLSGGPGHVFALKNQLQVLTTVDSVEKEQPK